MPLSITETKKTLLGLTLDELKTVATETGLPKFAGAPLAKWIYEQHVPRIAAMTNI